MRTGQSLIDAGHVTGQKHSLINPELANSPNQQFIDIVITSTNEIRGKLSIVQAPGGQWGGNIGSVVVKAPACPFVHDAHVSPLAVDDWVWEFKHQAPARTNPGLNPQRRAQAESGQHQVINKKTVSKVKYSCPACGCVKDEPGAYRKPVTGAHGA